MPTPNQSPFLQKLKALQELVVDANQNTPKEHWNIAIQQLNTIIIKIETCTSIEEGANNDFSVSSLIPTQATIENKEKGTETTLGYNKEDQTLEVTQENEEKKLNLQVALSKKGIQSGLTKKLEVEAKGATFGIGFIKVQPAIKLEAELSLQNQILVDQLSVEANIDFHAEGNITAYIDVFDIFEFGGIFRLKYDTQLTASLSVDEKGGRFRLHESPHDINASVELFLRPGDTIVDIIQIVYDIWMELSDGDGDKKFDKEEMHWTIPIADINLYNFSIPSIEIPLDEDIKLSPSMDLVEILQKEADELNGFAGTIIDIVHTVKDVIDFVDNLISDIGSFFEELWDDIVDGLEDLWDNLTKSDQEIARERLEEYLEVQGKQAFGIIFKAALQKMKKSPKHVKALSKIDSSMARMAYTYGVIWADVQTSPIVANSLKALANGNHDVLDANLKIATTKFEIQDHTITGTQKEEAFVIGTDLEINLNLGIEQEEAENYFRKMMEIVDNKIKGRTTSVAVKGSIEITLYCNDTIVNQTYISIDQMMDATKMTLPYHTSLEIKNKDLPDSTEAKWYLQWKIDFLGDIFDITGPKIPIQVTYQNIDDISQLPPVQFVLPEIGKIKKTGKSKKRPNGSRAFLQGEIVDITATVLIPNMPLEQLPLNGTMFTRLFYNGKPIRKSTPHKFYIAPRHLDQGKRMVKVGIEIPQNDNYEDSELGARWALVLYLKIAGMQEIIKKQTRLTVFNDKKNYTPLPPTQSIASDIDLGIQNNSTIITNEENDTNNG